MSQSNETYYTNESDIIVAFQNLTSDHFDERTLHSWINYFKKCMYYASADYFNPMFFSLVYDLIKTNEKYPQEFLFIHKLMYRFLCQNNDAALIFIPYTDIEDNCELICFEWNIPSRIMPFLISYIKATNKFKKNEPIISFFDELNETFMDTIKHQNDLTQKEYLTLTENELCQKYFRTLDEIYHTFAKTAVQHNMIQHSIFYLSQALTALPLNNYHAKNNAYILLTSFKEKLYLQSSSSPNAELDLLSLYPYSVPWEIQGEYEQMRNVKKILSFFPQKLFSFLEENLDLNTTYHIAAKDYETFSSKYTSLLSELEEKVLNCQKDISDFYDDVTNHPEIRHALNNGQLEIDYKKLYDRSSLLIGALSSYFASISKKTKNFKNKVKKASTSCPQNYITLKIEHDYLKTFEHSITSIQANLYGEKFMNTFDSYKSFLFYNRSGLVKELTYPNMVTKKESLRLICELTQTMYPLSEDYVIEQFLNRVQFYPMPLFVFLLQCNDVIVDLNLF
ncbi:MAG: hypothetical protein SOU16_11980 [Faecalimonas sp.]|nr:hypothetical protein [Faecalimonas sp.]